MKKIKVMTILGTRPEIIRLSRILPMLDEYVDHRVVYTGQNFDYELSDIFFNELKLRKPDYLLEAKSVTLGEQIGNIIRQSEKVMIKERPDALLVLGDTNSSLSAIIAKRLKIMIFHMEAGNRCFDWNVPEETNRALVDQISDINLPYTEHGRRYLLHQGIHPSKIFVTGSPLTEVYHYYSRHIDTSKVLHTLSLNERKYFVVSTHREENVDNPVRLKALFDAFTYIAELYKFPIIVTLHPRTRKRIEGRKDLHPLIKFYKPFGFFDYAKLEKHAFCVLSDSGTIQEESSLLHFTAVQIRANLERPEAFDAGAMILTGTNASSVENAIHLVADQRRRNIIMSTPKDYEDVHVSMKVTKLIMGLASVRKYDGI